MVRFNRIVHALASLRRAARRLPACLPPQPALCRQIMNEKIISRCRRHRCSFCCFLGVIFAQRRFASRGGSNGPDSSRPSSAASFAFEIGDRSMAAVFVVRDPPDPRAWLRAIFFSCWTRRAACVPGLLPDDAHAAPDPLTRFVHHRTDLQQVLSLTMFQFSLHTSISFCCSSFLHHLLY